MPASDCTPQPNAPSTPKEEYIVSVDGESVFVLWSANRSTICEVLTGDTKTARRERAEVIAASFNSAIEYPWTDDGPSVAEAGGESILVRTGEDLVRGNWYPGIDRQTAIVVRLGTASPEFLLREGWYDDLGSRLAGDHAPTGWRRMPKARTIRGHIAVDE